MNLVLTSPTWLTIPLLLLVLAAAIEDIVRLKISNITCGLVFLGALIAMALHGFHLSLWQNFVVFAAILSLGTPAFAAGWLGGGDVKLLAALGLWVDLQGALSLISAVLLAGGLVAILSILGRRAGVWHRGLSSREARIPYGVAIATGALFVYAVQLRDKPSNPYIDHLRALQAQQNRTTPDAQR